MNLRFLRTFVTTAELGALGRACARLNLSQPAASRQIHALESELGITLFQQIGRKLELTSEGEDLLRQSRRLLSDADLLTERAHALRQGKTGIIRIAAAPQMITSLLAPFLPGHRRRYPEIEVQLIEGNITSQRSRLERGEVHLAIMPAVEGRFARRLLFPIHVLVVMLKTHRLAEHAIVELADLANEAVLLMQREYGSRIWFDAMCEIAQIWPRVLLESITAHTLIELAAANYGIAVVPSTTLIRHRKLRAVPLVHQGRPIGRWSTVCWDPQRIAPSYVERFVHELVAHARRASPGREYLRHAPALPEPQHLVG